MAKVFVIAEHRDGRLKKSTFELLGASSAAGNETHAILLGDGVADLAKELGQYGAKKVHVAQNPALKFYTAEAYSKVIVDIVKSASADIVLASHTPTGRDFMPRVAARLGVGLASDCTQLAFEGSQIKVRRPVYAGKATAEVEFVGRRPTRSPPFAPMPWARRSPTPANPPKSSMSRRIWAPSRPRSSKSSRAPAAVPT